MTHDQFYRIGIILTFIWTACFSWSLVEVKLEFLFDGDPMYFILALIVIFALYCLNPFFRCGYRTARFQLLITLKEIFISPFGRVRFRDFFFADVITSMSVPLSDIGNTCYYIKHFYNESTHQEPSQDIGW